MEEEEVAEEEVEEEEALGQVFIRPVVLADFEDACAKILAQMSGKDEAAWELGPGELLQGEGEEAQEAMTDTH